MQGLNGEVIKTATKKKGGGELNTGIKCYTVQNAETKHTKQWLQSLQQLVSLFFFKIVKFPESGLKVHGI